MLTKYIAVLAVLGLTTCKSTNSTYQIQENAQLDPAPVKEPQLCVALRGNGNLIMAHFGALARIVELYGLIEGGAGGSSSSISMFLYESIYSNKLVSTCGEQANCSEQQRAARAAFLLKSVLGYLQVLGNTAEAVAFKSLYPLAKAAYQSDTERLLQTNPEAARASIEELLHAQDLFSHTRMQQLINEDFLSFLNGKADLNFRTRESYEALAEFGKFQVNDKRVFVRPGVLNFSEVAELVGHIGDFYAGLTDAETSSSMAGILDRCAESTRGQDWLTIAQSACGGQFHDTLVKYRDLRREHGVEKSVRAHQPVGTYLPLIPITAVIMGRDAISSIEAARKVYLTNPSPTLSPLVNFNLDFDKNVRFGYWGSNNVLAKAQNYLKTQTDLKSRKFISLGSASWHEALRTSPAEPGLSAIQPLRTDMLSAAGWADLHPVQVLKGIGCKKIIYITREGGESEFAMGVAKQLGMKQQQKSALFDLKKGSSQQNAIDMADGIWCTDWNKFSGAATGDVAAHMIHAYNAPMISTDPKFSVNASGYANTQKATAKPGCKRL